MQCNEPEPLDLHCLATSSLLGFFLFLRAYWNAGTIRICHLVLLINEGVKCVQHNI